MKHRSEDQAQLLWGWAGCEVSCVSVGVTWVKALLPADNSLKPCVFYPFDQGCLCNNCVKNRDLCLQMKTSSWRVIWRSSLQSGVESRGGMSRKEGGYWSPAPVVCGKVNRKLSQKSQSVTRRPLLSSRPQRHGSAGGLKTGNKVEMWNWSLKVVDSESLFFLWVMSHVWDSGGAAHHLAADWECAAMIMWEGPLSDLCCWPIPARTDMAMASAAALELRPLCLVEGLGAKELCWMTGAGEPVGSEVSFKLSSAAKEGGKKEAQVQIL